jgi:outer membrane autotransporter protein
MKAIGQCWARASAEPVAAALPGKLPQGTDTARRVQPRRLLPCAALVVGLASLGDAAIAQQTVRGMILPNGQVVSGPVFRSDGTFVTSITTGADANLYIRSTAPTASFLPSGPAAVVRTTAPTLYVRAYTAGVTNPVGGFIAPSNAIRGLTGQQIRDVLALPYAPDSLTIVQVPAGTCVLYGPAAPINGNFAANPPAIPTAGPWGNGGVLQGSLIGPSSDPNCANAGRVPAQNFLNRQLVGGFALAYRPNAGAGNTYAVAAALDVGAFPDQFTDMDNVYNSLDLLNYGSPENLQVALKQLDGESYADFGFMRMTAARVFLDVMHQQMRGTRIGRPAPTRLSSAPLAMSLADPQRPSTEMAVELKQQFSGGGERRTEAGGVWVAPYGSVGAIYGDATTHSASYALHGFAAGGDLRIADDLLIGGGLSYAGTSFSTSIPAAYGSNEAVSVAAYASYSPAPWYVDAALGYAYNWGTLSRTIAFPGIFSTAQGNPTANQFLGSVESGMAVPLTPRLALTPFGRLEVTTATQNGFSESGAGGIGLNAAAQTTTGVRSIIGLQLSGSTSITEQQDLWLTLRLGWAHDYADLSGTLTANFLGKPDTSFTVVGPTPDRNAATVGVSANLPLALGQAFVNYDANLSQSYSTHSMTVGLKIVF